MKRLVFACFVLGGMIIAAVNAVGDGRFVENIPLFSSSSDAQKDDFAMIKREVDAIVLPVGTTGDDRSGRPASIGSGARPVRYERVAELTPEADPYSVLSDLVRSARTHGWKLIAVNCDSPGVTLYRDDVHFGVGVSIRDRDGTLQLELGVGSGPGKAVAADFPPIGDSSCLE